MFWTGKYLVVWGGFGDAERSNVTRLFDVTDIRNGTATLAYAEVANLARGGVRYDFERGRWEKLSVAEPTTYLTVKDAGECGVGESQPHHVRCEFFILQPAIRSVTFGRRPQGLSAARQLAPRFQYA